MSALRQITTLTATALIAAASFTGGTAALASAATPHAARHLPASHLTSAPRQHDRPYCPIDDDGDCLQTVRGTALGTTGTNIRSGPGTGYSLVGNMPYHSTGTVYCYTTGTVINNNPYWDYTESSYGNGYVSDDLLYTGRNIYQQVDPC